MPCGEVVGASGLLRVCCLGFGLAAGGSEAAGSSVATSRIAHMLGAVRRLPGRSDNQIERTLFTAAVALFPAAMTRSHPSACKTQS